MRNPGERGGDRRRVAFFREFIAEEAVELVAFDDVQGRARDVVALLVARDDEAGARMDGDVRLAEAIAEAGGGAAVGGEA